MPTRSGGHRSTKRWQGKRAEAVRNALVKSGVPDYRIVTRSLGARVPISDNGTREGRAANRRVEIASRRDATMALQINRAP
ncbi:MAG TPA: OmpA family protein [Casimicrobiaceae bacterium]|nr:OmpA family protein [Casimicrobiaceae bacterium]